MTLATPSVITGVHVFEGANAQPVTAVSAEGGSSETLYTGVAGVVGVDPFLFSPPLLE